MSYTPHTWVDQETITAAKLNNIEEGIDEASQSGSGGLLVETTFIDDGQYDKYYKTSITANNILNAYQTGSHIVFHCPSVEGGYNGECYTSLIGYLVPDTEAGRDEHIDVQYVDQINGVSRTQDGYIKLNIYVD